MDSMFQTSFWVINSFIYLDSDINATTVSDKMFYNLLCLVYIAIYIYKWSFLHTYECLYWVIRKWLILAVIAWLPWSPDMTSSSQYDIVITVLYIAQLSWRTLLRNYGIGYTHSVTFITWNLWLRSELSIGDS